MATVTTLMFVLAWLYAAYRLGGYLFGNPPSAPARAEQHTSRPDVDRVDVDRIDVDRLDMARLRRDMALACTHDSPPDELGELPPDPVGSSHGATERREATLARQLLAGTLDANEYRRQMAELAQGRAPSAGTPER